MSFLFSLVSVDVHQHNCNKRGRLSRCLSDFDSANTNVHDCITSLFAVLAFKYIILYVFQTGTLSLFDWLNG
jgi:hypothetical protein